MDFVDKIAGPAISLIGSVAPVAASLFQKQPKMPSVKTPTPVPLPTMPTKDDNAARAAKFKTIATRASQHGRSSTNLYDKQETLGN